LCPQDEFQGVQQAGVITVTEDEAGDGDGWCDVT
jgi:hypothetical protein